MALLYSSQVQGQKEIRRESYIETWTYFIWTDARQRPDSCNHLADWLFNFLCDQLSWGPTYICTKQVLKVIHCRWKSLGGFYPGGSEVNLNHLKSVHASNFSGKQVNIADWSIWPHGLKHFTPSLSPDCEGFWVCDSDHPWRIRYSAFQICFYNHAHTKIVEQSAPWDVFGLDDPVLAAAMVSAKEGLLQLLLVPSPLLCRDAFSLLQTSRTFMEEGDLGVF